MTSLLVLLASLLSQPALADKGKLATIEEVIYTQQIEIRSPMGGRQVPALMSQVPANSRVITGKEAQIAFRMPDQSLVRVGPLSDVTLDSIRPEETSVSVEHGRMIVRVKPATSPAKRNKFTVRTRNVVMGVRGTEFTVRAEKNQDVVVHTVSGVIEVVRAGQALELTSGKGVELKGDGSEKRFEFDSSNHVAQFFVVQAEAGVAPAPPEKESFFRLIWRLFVRIFDKLRS